MNKIAKAIVFVAIAISCTFCSDPSKINDIIAPINLNRGEEASFILSDLFYSDTYNIDFFENDFLKVDYDSEAGELKIFPDEKFTGMTVLNFTLKEEKYSIPVIVKKEFKQKFVFKTGKKYNQLTVFGSFNDWNRNQYSFTDNDENGEFEVEVTLQPGIYQYKFYADGEEIVDPLNNELVDNGSGSFNNVLVIPPTPEDKMFLHILGQKIDGDKKVYSFEYHPANGHGNISSENVFAFLDNKQLVSDIEVENGRISIGVDKGYLRGEQMLRAVVSDSGYQTNIQMVLLDEGNPVTNESKFNWYGGSMYSLLIDRFNDGDTSLNMPIEHDTLFDKANYMGGDLQGVIDKIEEGYFSDLGVNVIWISPVYDNPEIPYKEYPAPHRYYSGYHGYWPISHTRVENRFGDLNKLKELVKTAHSKNIKILLDFVSNHVHKEHPVFKEHPEWFGNLELPDGRLNLRYWDEFRLTTWFEPYLPSFDYTKSEKAIEYMAENAVWWLEETGADGFRHDAVKHVPNVFWRKLTETLNEKITTKRKIHTYQIGETFGSYDLVSSYVNNGQLSSQFNFNLYNVAQAVFIDPERSFRDLALDLKKTRSVYGNLHYMGNIMDSHDKNRYMAYADGDLDLSQWSAIEEGWNNPPAVDDPASYKKAEIYYAYMMSIPGLPVVYYGSEFGMTGASDPDNRRMMRFGDELSENESAMLDQTKLLLKLRNEHTALRFGDFYPVYSDKDLFAYVRSDFNERVLIVINKNPANKRAELTIPAPYNTTSIVNLVDGNEIPLERDNVSVVMDGISWKYFLLK